MLENIIRKYLESAGIDLGQLNNPELKMRDLGLDSLGMVEMLFEIEDRYGFQLDDPMRFGDMHFNEMVADIEASIRARNNGELPDIKE